jgi:FPC/CPF motif-containing protein YcgG
MTATAMTFYVKSETADGSLNLTSCFEPHQVFENLEDQRKMGREAWVEDAGRKVLDEMTFKPNSLANSGPRTQRRGGRDSEGLRKAIPM